MTLQGGIQGEGQPFGHERRHHYTCEEFSGKLSGILGRGPPYAESQAYLFPARRAFR